MGFDAPAHPSVFTDAADLEKLQKTNSPFARKLSRENGPALLDLLDRWMDGDDDLAYCKPAITSSASEWARHQDPKQDACGANGESSAWDYGFCTRSELQSWWMVDLGAEHLIDGIALLNRLNYPERFQTFSILSSNDDGPGGPVSSRQHPEISSDPQSRGGGSSPNLSWRARCVSCS